MQEEKMKEYQFEYVKFEENHESKILQFEDCLERWPYEFKNVILVFNKPTESRKRSCKEYKLMFLI